MGHELAQILTWFLRAVLAAAYSRPNSTHLAVSRLILGWSLWRKASVNALPGWLYCIFSMFLRTPAWFSFNSVTSVSVFGSGTKLTARWRRPEDPPKDACHVFMSAKRTSPGRDSRGQERDFRTGTIGLRDRSDIRVIWQSMGAGYHTEAACVGRQRIEV